MEDLFLVKQQPTDFCEYQGDTQLLHLLSLLSAQQHPPFANEGSLADIRPENPKPQQVRLSADP